VSSERAKASPEASRAERAAAVGSDDRVVIADTSLYPHTIIGQLVVTWRDGTQSICTGTLVSANVVLTAGQCAHDRERGGFAVRASFAPGQTQTQDLGAVSQPHGSRHADYVETNNRWTLISGGETVQLTDARSDYGAYYFVQGWTHAATYMPIVYGDTQTGTMNTAGYPTAVRSQKSINQAMWLSAGSETTRSVNLLRAFQVREFTMDVSAGNNGGPIWSYDGITRRIAGIISYGSDEVAGGVWFGGENAASVAAMVSWTPTRSAPVHTSSNLRVAGVFSGASTATDSYLRFFNATPQDGTVTVRIADSNSGALLGTWTSPTVKAFASSQFQMRTIELDATPRITPTANRQYTLNVSATFGLFFQHVVWNQVGASLTNLSGCGNGWSKDVLHTSNVHSSVVKDYPSVIVVHNLDVKAADATLAFYDSKTGNRIGGVKIPSIPSDAAVAFAITDAEKAMGFSPSSSISNYQDHYNVIQEGDFLGYFEHLVYNNGAGVITNLSAKCHQPML